MLVKFRLRQIIKLTFNFLSSTAAPSNNKNCAMWLRWCISVKICVIIKIPSYMAAPPRDLWRYNLFKNLIQSLTKLLLKNALNSKVWS